MNGIRRHLMIYIIIIFHSVVLFTQDIEHTFKLGKSLYEKGDYDASLDLFQRVIFFDDEGLYLKETMLATANIYFLKKEYNKSAAYYTRTLPFYSNSERDAIAFQIVYSHLAEQNYYAAYEELLQLEYELSSNDALPTYYFLLGTMHFGLLDHEKSKMAFYNMAQNDPISVKEIDYIFNNLIKKEKKREKRAYYMSAIFPGLGQLYAHDYRNGLNVFLLSTGFIVLATYTALNSSATSAFLNVIPWWSRYHIGGMNRAKDIVKQYKIKHRKKSYIQLLNLYQLHQSKNGMKG
jgi:tetratricopeptide (TPR) repeat protein